MSEPFLAEIKIVGFNFAPRGWAFCDGQVLPINQNQSLYSLLGTTYGGDGVTSFSLPDLRGRTPMHEGEGFALGDADGRETVTLSDAQMAAHSHSFMASTTPAQNNKISSAEMLGATTASTAAYSTDTTSNLTTFRANSMSSAGGGQAHENMQPYLALSFCIALQGLFPSRN